jgi:protein-S-isoprenylcysteine O-methyltransferase Ste14
VTTLGTLGTYLGLCLLGWGLTPLPSFFASPPKVAYALIVGVFAVAVGYQVVVAPEGVHGARGRPEKAVRRQTVLGAALVVILFGSLVLLPFADRHGLAVYGVVPALQWVGVAGAGIGFLLVFLSGWFLGRQYSAHVTLQEDHQLVTSGPYRYVRHPRYLGVVLLALGLSLLFRSWIGLGLLVVIVSLLGLRVADEEAMLRSAFGARWDEYCSRTKRFLPGIF